MTSTEDRLADALRARTEFVSQESLRELVPPAFESSRPTGRVWLGALAAAAAVLVIVGGAIVIRNRTPDAGSRSAITLPKYRVEVDEDSDVVVRSTATGKIISRLSDTVGVDELSATGTSPISARSGRSASSPILRWPSRQTA